MFWGSRRDDFSDSDYDDYSEDEEAYARSSRSNVRRDRALPSRSGRKGKAKASASWFGAWFSPPAKKKSPNKRSKKSKVRNKSCFPRSSHGWGVLCLTVLLAIYLVDFFHLLYREKAASLGPASVATPNVNVGENGTGGSQPSGIVLERRVHSPSTKHGSMAEGSSVDGSAAAFQAIHQNSNLNIKHENELAAQNGLSSTSGRSSPQVHAQPRLEEAGTELGGNTAEENHSLLASLPKSPMNRNMEELQVPGGIGDLPMDTIKEYYRRLAKAYLSTFSKGIYRQLYFDILRRRTYALTPPGANKGVQSILFQIIDKRVYMMDPYEVPRNSKPFYRTRINQVIWLLSKLAREGRIKNTEFLMAIHDCVQTVNKPHTYRGAAFQESNPSFTIVTCNFSDNVPFPMWEGSKHRDGGFSGWDATVANYAKDTIPWEQKENRAVFRGGNRPSMYFRNKSDANDHCNEVGRTRLLYLSKQKPDYLDVSIGGTCGGVHHSLNRLEAKEHHQFKYIMYAEGNCMWADRTRQQVFGPSTIIKQETPCGQFFEPLMRPNTHYIPTDFFFTDTLSQVAWARDNDVVAQEIVKNANEFAHNFLSLKGIEAYVEVLFEEYTALLVEPDIKVEDGAIDVTDKRV